MGKRTRIINDPSDLVPLLQVFGSDRHKKVFDTLLNDWLTEPELEKKTGTKVNESLELLRKCGLVESKWRMPEPGKNPEKEYHSSYSRVQVNFQCSIEDISDMLLITFENDHRLKSTVETLEKEVAKGNQSMIGLSRVLERSPVYIRSAAKRSPNLVVKGQRIEIVGATG